MKEEKKKLVFEADAVFDHVFCIGKHCFGSACRYKEQRKTWFSGIPLIGKWMTSIWVINNVLNNVYELFPREKFDEKVDNLKGDYKITLIVEPITDEVVEPQEEFTAIVVDKSNGILLGENELIEDENKTEDEQDKNEIYPIKTE